MIFKTKLYGYRIEQSGCLHDLCFFCLFFFSLPESGISAQVVAAVDINTTANKIYRHNFPDTPLWNKTIEVGSN